MKFAFSKYQGAGNDFILFDDRENIFPSQKRGLISRLCHRQYGVGADGLILLQKSTHADARMRVFNADGSEAAMCGNGLRCLFRFMQELGICTQSAQIETTYALFRCMQSGEEVGVLHPLPKVVQSNMQLGSYQCDIIDSGVPHALVFVDHIACVDVFNEGRKIRFHPHFSDLGVNVTFIQPVLEDELCIRTYERGVERETLACGTGAIAAACAAHRKFSQNKMFKIHTHSKEIFKIALKENELELKGPAMLVFYGYLTIGELE